MSSNEFLCVCDPEALRRRYCMADGWTRRWMDHFLWLAHNGRNFPLYDAHQLGVAPGGEVSVRTQPGIRMYGALAYLLTGDQVYARITREAFLEMIDSVSWREAEDAVQLHCWCDAAPFARWLIAYDWIYDSGVFDAKEHQYICERVLAYLWAHPFQRLKARDSQPGKASNQNASMALALVVGGFLFGVKYGHDVLALEMLDAALPHLVTFLTGFPRGGYSYEGSMYMGRVNALVLPLALDVAEQVMETNLFDVRATSLCASPREVFYAIMRLAIPGGLTLPWDNYGYIFATFTPAASYLASRTGDRRAFDMLVREGALERPEGGAWGYDRTLWTFLYWPEEGTPVQTPRWSFNHVEPSLGVGAAGPLERLHLFQMWDRCDPMPLREHTNPNALVMEYDGSPLLLDGKCVEVAKTQEFSQPEYCFTKVDIGLNMSKGPGTIGAHNCIFLDDEPYYTVPRTAEGFLVGSSEVEDNVWMEGDVTDCYRDSYDVLAVRRATLLCGDDWVLSRDRICSSSAQTLNGRWHLRDGTLNVNKDRCLLTTSNGTRLEVCGWPDSNFSIRHFVGDLSERDRGHNQLESACHELTWRAVGDDVTHLTLFVPSRTRRLLYDLTNCWHWTVADDMDAARHLLDSDSLWTDKSMTIDLSGRAWFFETSRDEPGVGIYRRELRLNAPPPDSLWLHLPRLVRSIVLHINESVYEINLAPHRGILPPVIDISGSLRKGLNRIVILAPSTLEWSLHGPVGIWEEDEPGWHARLFSPRPGEYIVEHRGRRDHIWWTDDGCRMQREGEAIVEMSSGVDAEVVANPEFQSSEEALRRTREVLAMQLHKSSGFEKNDAVLVAEIGSPDWRIALRALEEAWGKTSPAIVEAVMQVLRREQVTHPTLPRREAGDVCWYRLKAACAYTLGEARCEAAVALLGHMLLGDDFYPVTAACAWALGRIGTPEALDWLREVNPAAEQNTHLRATNALQSDKLHEL